MKNIMRILFTIVSLLVLVGLNKVSAQESSNVEKTSLQSQGGSVYQNGKLLTIEEVKTILSNHPSELEFYTRGKELRGNGTGLLWGGIAASVCGFVIMANNIETVTDQYGYETVEVGSGYYAGLLLVGAGEGMIVGGCICLSMGKNKIARAVRDFNTSANSHGPAKLNLAYGLSSRGLTIALQF